MTSVYRFIALLYAFAPTVDGFVNSADNTTRRALTTTTAILDFISASFQHYRATGYNDAVFLGGLDQLTKVNDLYKQIPDFTESIVLTALAEPSKVTTNAELAIPVFM